jgi:hypothetical protein
MALEKFKAPQLINPPQTYSRDHFLQQNRLLEIYFGRLDSLTPNQAQSYRADVFYGGGEGLKIPHIAASDSTDQFATGNDTATVVRWNTLDAGYGWELNSPGSATAQYPGIYTIRYSLQFKNDSNSIHFATVWLRKNGSNSDNSATKFFIPSRKSNTAGEEGYVAGYSEATFVLDAGDEIELMWATDVAATSGGGQGVYIFHDAAQTTPFARPAIPSAIGSISFVSAII